MINVYRSNAPENDCPINHFAGRTWLAVSEVEYVRREIFGKPADYAKPAIAGNWAWGGNFLYTSNEIFPEYSDIPIKLHDRNMDMEG